VFKVENSTCVSVKEVQKEDEYRYLEVWEQKYGSHLGISTLTNLNLATLKIYYSCPKSKDL
jgi:hypothetical protein